MIPLLILWLMKNFRKIKIITEKVSTRKTVQLIIFVVFVSGFVRAQEKIFRYNILHNGEIKGSMAIYQSFTNNKVHLKLESEVNTRFLIKVTVKSIEEAIFENGVLIYSSLCRIVNGNEKINQKIQATGVNYKVLSKDGTVALPKYPINHSVLSLYYQEPVNLTKIYSDNYQKYVDIKKVADNKYRVQFPNGNINYYSYTNGVCTQVEVNQFYDLQFQLIQ